MSTSLFRGDSGTVRLNARRRAVAVVAIAALAVLVGVLTVVQPGAAAALAGSFFLIAVLLSTRSVAPGIDLRGKRFQWVAFAWAYVMIRPIGHFTTGRTTLTAVAGIPSVENVTDLATHAAIATLALWSLRRNGLGMRPRWLILVLPTLALVSSAWSLAPTVTLGFSFELVAIVLLATLTAAIQTADPDLGRLVLRRTLRLVVQVVGALCILGLLLPHRGGAAVLVAADDTRFTWPGEHPLVATAEIGFALLVIVFAGREDAGFSWPSRASLIGLFGVCLYLGQSRTAWAGLVASALFGYWYLTRGSGVTRRLAGAAAIAATVFLIASSLGGPLAAYLYRGQSQQQVASLDGRLGLWTFTLHQLHSPGRWLVGYGLSGSRVLLASSVAWAGDAHSAWLELLVSLGLVGAVLGVTVVAILGARLLRNVPNVPLPSRVLPILFIYVLAMSPVATGFAAPGPEPGLGFALLGFAYAATVGRAKAFSRARPSPAQLGVDPAPSQLEGGLRPAPI